MIDKFHGGTVTVNRIEEKRHVLTLRTGDGKMVGLFDVHDDLRDMRFKFRYGDNKYDLNVYDGSEYGTTQGLEAAIYPVINGQTETSRFEKLKVEEV